MYGTIDHYARERARHQKIRAARTPEQRQHVRDVDAQWREAHREDKRRKDREHKRAIRAQAKQIDNSTSSEVR